MKLKYGLVVLLETAMRAVMCLPRFRLCCAMKSLFLRCLGAKVGQRVIYYPGVWICTGRNLEIGDDVNLALGVLMGTDGGVKIGNRTLIGFRTQIISGNHVIPENHGKIFYSGYDRKPIIIGDDVWIGANCLILAGVTIGEGAVVAGGSVVNKSVEPYTIVGGVPAKFIRSRS